MTTHRGKIHTIRTDTSSVIGPSIGERMRRGKALRKKVSRTSHAKWTPPSGRPDPVEVLRQSDRGRLPELLPIRYGRMRQSPFAFFRGSAALMAWDLSKTPATGVRVQACGDCHAANFGGFASPERQLLFDINDFDETLQAPWEWDVKRLAASIVLASRELGLSAGRCEDSVHTMAKSYRDHMREYAHMRNLEVWYSRMDAEVFIKEAKTAFAKKRWKQVEDKARLQTAEHIFPKIADVINGRTRIVDRPPLMYHTRESDLMQKHVTQMFRAYRETLPAERRVILDRYHIIDVARKVVGVGSVGTRCAVALLMAGEHDPMLLQFKEALPSVLEPYAGKSRYANHGERVVTGQRMLQSASDVFLGWTRDGEGRSYYFRQLRDMKMKIDLDNMTKGDWLEYLEICGWTLARAHARTGDAAIIAGYLGRSEKFDAALAEFATSYANQADRDYAALLKAIRAGRLKAQATAAA
ncbi:MAG TPA: DUF2252 domain-containing protein [Candidatus Acidoferrales bacterium]|nr:DUF2252 domain-containing protein [Candidatus Acidoferrales bacterium]